MTTRSGQTNLASTVAIPPPTAMNTDYVYKSNPRRNSTITPHLLCLFGLMIFTSHVFAEPRVPLPALPSMALGLYHNRFDEAYWFGKQRSETVQTEAGTLVESWSGYALQRAGNNVTPFVVPAVGERGQLNVACDFGSVGFWFKPYWSSAAVMAGNAPGVPARLVDLVVIGSQDAAVGWSLQSC